MNNIFITRRMRKIAWPLTINTLTFYAVAITDSVFIGHYRPDGLDILNTIMLPYITLNQLMDYMHMGTVILATQAIGAKFYHKAQKIVENGFFVYSIVGVVFWALWFFGAEKIYRLLDPSAETLKIAVDYMHIVSFSYLMNGFIYKGVQSVFSTTGYTKPFMIVGIVQVMTNTVFNRLFIYGDFFFPELGISGAAWGTIVSTASGNLLMLYYLFQQKNITPTLKGILHPDKKLAFQTIRMGFPVGIDMVLWGLGGNFLVWVINNTDPSLNRFMFFFITLPEFGFRMYSGYILAVTNLAGRAFGAHNIKKVIKVMYFGLRDAGMISLGVALIYVFFAKYIAYMFTSDPQTIALLEKYIPLMVLITLPRTLWEIFNGILHGMGITFWGMFVQMVGLTAIALQSYFFVGQLHWGVFGIFLIYVVDEVLRVIFMGGRLFFALKKYKS